MANPHNVELEAAKFLQKLIQESKDEPTKLATKLYVILQHMRASGKENSLPYQVISMAMETVIKQNGLDIEALTPSRLPVVAGTQVGESGPSQGAGSSQRVGVAKDAKASLTGNELSKPEAYSSGRTLVGPSSSGQDIYQGSPSSICVNSWLASGYVSQGSTGIPGAAGKIHGVSSGAASLYAPGETGMSMPMQFAGSSFDNQGFAAKMHKDGMESFSAAPPPVELSGGKNIVGKALDHEGGAHVLPNANNLIQGSFPSNAPESSVPRAAAAALRDSGKAPIPQAPASDMPFKDHQLKQLRAQCLVFLAFRNGLMPKKAHLEIALGNFLPKEDGPRRDLIEHKGKEQSINDPSWFPEGSRASGVIDHSRSVDRLPSGTPSTGTHAEARLLKESNNSTSMEEEKSQNAAVSEHADGKRHHLESQASSLRGMQSDSNARNVPVSNREPDAGKNHQQIAMPYQASLVMGPTKQLRPDMSSWMGNGCQTETSKASPPASALAHESLTQRKENAANHCRGPGPADGQSVGNRCIDSNLPGLLPREQWKPVSAMNGQNNLVMPMKESDVFLRTVMPAQELDMEEEDASVTTDKSSSPKYTMSEKWIMERQKRKFLTDKMWALKQRKTEQRIAVCSGKLKESVSSSEDIFAKTKSVIELKKLQLLELQRRLRSDILNDFFKPIAADMDRLKSIKKHRIGRRSKQLERYEQRMKEERQKRIRERQKEFFSEIEVHRERLEDAFKMKRERWKGFNKYVREFHKKKERIHREKIDRIQREKINLLKINDVEGYLRMVQDAKSDRVKQLLKETEKYLQKLGSKLQEAKSVAWRFETDLDENRTTNIFEKNDIDIENEDETDQAKHYLESNEKYYTMAHSIKESVLEQPSILVGGKLREYQMNGLRWLVSLYNNHLNGILADEMGLGKTVQVIALICYLMETKNDRGPFLVVVPSSVLPGWESEINFWAPRVLKIVYSGPPEERRRLFKEQIVHQRFNVLLTTYEYLMNKHDRPKLSKIHWHYVIIDEGHRIKNASCKLNAELKHYRSNHRLLLTGTPLQNNLEELWALLNFLLPNIFNSSEDFSQWFNKPFESNGDNSADEALLSEEENLLIINRLHQVLRPFVLRRLKHKVENQLPEKIERLIRCEASAYQKLLMKRVEENLGALGTSKARSVHNSVMELRNICNHPYLSQLHVEEVHDFIPKHFLPNVVRLCGKLEMLDRLLPKLKATDHRVLLFSTMTRLLDVMEDYLCWKQYRYLRLDGHTSGGDRGALIEKFNEPGSPFFIFLLSIRAGGVGVNLQAADTVIIFDTDWNPQVDLQAQARAHRIGQKKDVLVLRLETVQTVEEQVRAAAEHKLGVANQSITAGFFDNNTSAEDRREYLESLLRECKKEEAAPVLCDDALNDLIARSESEIDVFESLDRRRREEEMEAWMKLAREDGTGDSKFLPSLPSRLLTDDDLKPFYEAMKISEAPQQGVAHNTGVKRKGDSLGGLDTQHYGRGKRAREVRSYEEQWTEEEFEKMCQVDPPESPHIKEEIAEKKLATVMSSSVMLTGETEVQLPLPPPPLNPSVESTPSKEVTPPCKRGRGRPRRTATEITPSTGAVPSSGIEVTKVVPKVENVLSSQKIPGPSLLPASSTGQSTTITVQQPGEPRDLSTHSASLPYVAPQPTSLPYVTPQPTALPCPSTPVQGRGRGRKAQSAGEAPRRRGKRQTVVLQAVPLPAAPTGTVKLDMEKQGEAATSSVRASNPDPVSQSSTVRETVDLANLASNVPLPSSSANLVSHGPLSSSPATSKLDLYSQPGPVSSSSMVPTPDSFPGSSATPSVGEQEPVVRTAPFPDPGPVLPFPSAISGPLSTTSHPALKQGRGRGRKAQTGVEAPRRRGKRQIAETPIGSEVLTDQDPKSAETPQKKSRVSVGRKASTINNQELEALKQMNVTETIASPRINNAAIAQVSEDKPEDEAQKIAVHSETSSSLADSRLPPVHDNKWDSKAQRSTDVDQADATQSIADPKVMQISGGQKENEAQGQTNVLQSNVSKNIGNIPMTQTCDSKQENEAQKQTAQCNALKEIAVPPIVQRNKGEMDNEGQCPKEVPQLDPSQITADPSVTKTVENQQQNEAEKQINTIQSDPSEMKADVTPVHEEIEHENEAHKSTGLVDSDVSQSRVDHPVVQVNKDVQVNDDAHGLNSITGQHSSQTIAGPSVCEVCDVKQENEVKKQNDDAQSDAFETTRDSSASEVHKACLQYDATMINQTSCETPVSEAKDSVLTLSVAIVGPIVLDADRKCQSQSSNDAGDEVGEVLGNEYSVPKEGSVSTWVTMETAALTIDGSLNTSGGLAIEQDVKFVEEKKTAIEEAVGPKYESTINQSMDGGDEVGEVQGNEYSVPEESCISTRVTMESAASTIDDSLKKSDGLTIKQGENGLEGKETAFEKVVAAEHESIINQSKHSGDEAGEVLQNEYSVPEEGCNPTWATLESAVSTIDCSSNQSGGLAIEQDVNGLEGKDIAFQEIVARKHESTINESLPDDSRSTSPMLEPPMTSYSPVSEHENRSGEKDAKQHENMDCVVDQPFVSDSELTKNGNVTEKDGDAPCLPLSVTASIVETDDRSSDDNTVMAISTSVREASVCDNAMCEALNGNDGTEDVEKVKSSLADGLNSLLNEGIGTVAAEHSEERSDSQSLKIVAQEHEKKECVQSHDPASVLTSSENVASVNEPSLDMSEVKRLKGDNSLLLNGATNSAVAAAASELLEERSNGQSDILVTQEHGEKESLQSHDPISVLSTSETVTLVNNLAVEKSEDFCHMGDTKEPEKEATLSDEVIVSKPEFTVGESLHEISSPTLRSLEQDSNITGDKAVEESPNQQKSKVSSAEGSLVPKPEVTSVESRSGKVDVDMESRDSVVEKNLGVITPGSVDNQSLEEITPSTCSTFNTETVAVDRPLRDCKDHAERRSEGEGWQTSTANQAFDLEPDILEAETGSSVEALGTSSELQQDDKASSLQILETQVASDEGREEKFEVESSEKPTAEVQEYKITDVVPSIEVACESLEVSADDVVSNAENHETTDGAKAGSRENEAKRTDTDMEADLVVSNAENPRTTDGANALTTETEAERMDMEVDLAVVQTIDSKDGQPEIREVEADSREDLEELDRGNAIPGKVSVSELEVTAAQHLEETSSTFSVLGREDVDAPIRAREFESPSDKETVAGEDRKVSKPHEASVPTLKFCEFEGKSTGMEILAGSERSAEEEAALESSVTEDVVARTPARESDRETEEGEDRKACNPDEASVPAPEFCKSGSKSTGMEIVGGSELCVEDEAHLENSAIEGVVAPTPVKESENQSDKESGEGEDQKACNPDEASGPAPPEFCESGSQSTDMEIMAGSELRVEEEAPVESSLIEDVVTPNLVKESENQSDKETGEEEGKKACNLDEASVPVLGEPGSGSSGMEIEHSSEQSVEVEALSEPGSKSSGMEIVPSSEQSVEVEAPLDKSLMEDVVSPSPNKEYENQSVKETEAGDGIAPNPNEASVPESKLCVSESKYAGMEAMVGSEKSIEEKAPPLQKSSPEVATEKSENESSKDFAAVVHGSADTEVDKAVVTVAEVNELQPPANAGTSEEHTDAEQLAGDNSKVATDLEVSSAVSQTIDMKDEHQHVNAGTSEENTDKVQLGGDTSKILTDLEVSSAASQTKDVKDDLPSLDNSSKASEIHESPSSVPRENEEKDKTE